MSDEALHVQCKLRHPDGRFTYGWIPKKPKLKVGATVDLQIDCKGEYQPGWVVEEMWATAPTSRIKARERDHMKHRQGTDAHRDSDGWVGPDR